VTPADGYEPPKPRFELSLVLLAVWLGLFAVAALPEHARLFGFELTKSELTRLWQTSSTRQERARDSFASPRAWAAAVASQAPAPAPVALDESPQRILIVGDSMLDGLLPRLADYAAENGHSLNAVIWYGSRTIDWARSSRLSDALRDYRPTFVMVVIGSSELQTRDIEKRTWAVQRILSTLGERKLVWVGPPNWRTDTGIGALLEREVGEPRYFRSLELSFERKRDGIHPTLASSQKWMDAVASWIMTRSAAKIRLSTPRRSGAPRPNARVFTPPSP
jgi:hypothetical protein